MPASLNLARNTKLVVAVGAKRSGQKWPFPASSWPFRPENLGQAAMPSWCLQTQPLLFHNQWDIHGMRVSHGTVIWAFLCPETGFPLSFWTPKPRTDHILGYAAQNDVLRAHSRGHVDPPATPHILWFPTVQIAPNEYLDPCTRANNATARCKLKYIRWVPKYVKRDHRRMPPRHAMPKQAVLAHSEPVLARFGPSKVPKCLQNGPIWDQK